MIQPLSCSLMPAAAGLAMPNEVALPAGGDMAETLDFSALLSLESEASEPVDQAAATVVALTLPKQVLAAAAAKPGKILPHALPEEPASEPQPEYPSPTLDPTLAPEPLAIHASPVVAIAPASPADPQGTAGDPPPEPASAPRPLPAMAAQAAVSALLSRPGPAQPDLAKQDGVQQIGPVVAETRTAASPTAPVPHPGKTALSPAPTEEVQIDLAGMVPAAPSGELRLPVEGAIGASSPPETAAAAPQTSAGNITLQGALPGPMPAQLAARPHDFSALIDRLTAAREALSPQNVAITVAHQDFGPVQLRFRSEDFGLSVAISSADPAFARAAAAAPLPVLPAGASDQAALSHQRGDAPQPQTDNSSGSGSFARQRGGSLEQGEHDPHPREHAHRPAAGARPDGRRGIFA